MEDEQEQRRRKVEAGKAKLAHFRQRKTKGACPHSKKKTEKRKGSTIDAPVQEENPVAIHDSEAPRRGVVCESTPCSSTLEMARGACAAQEQDCDLDGIGQQQQPPPLSPQTAHSLELEALRLSLNNMHTAQLELTQANLQKEKETALTELREMLNGRRAQELALLQSRQQCELELVREQHAREKEEMVLRCGQETAELKEKLRSEMEKNALIIENLKQDWESERELCLENLRKELSAKHQSEMESLQNQFQKELAEQRTELEKIFQAKNQAEVSLKNLETQHQVAIKKLQEDLQSEHCQYLEDLELKFREKEKEKQIELENLQASYEDLKAQSQEEIRSLWSQLETVRTNRKELNEPWEPLLARESHLEELEHLRLDFAQQQQKDRAQHESELEQLRVYFEKLLKDTEKTYQEDLTLFQQRLQEAREDSSLGSSEVSLSCIFPEETSDREGKEQLDQLDLQLEQPKENPSYLQTEPEEDHRSKSEVLSSSLHLQVKEDRSDSCCLEPEDLDVERLPSTHSDQHSQELAQAHLQCLQDIALEVDTQVATRVLGLEAEHKVKISLLQTELKEEIELLKIENRKLQHETHLKENLESLEGQVLSLNQKLEECHTELERLQQRRERENQEGATLIRMLRADLDLSQNEGKALRNALRRLLGLFGETLKAAVTLKNHIGERVGLFLDHLGAADAGQSPLAAPALDEMWSDEALLELDRTLPEGAEMSSVAEISSHVCESFFMSPENTLECEQPIRRVYQSLSMAVDGLLEMALDSSRQLEEARQRHCRVEKEFHQKKEETTQAVQKQQELLELLREESEAKDELALELHTAEGLLEGFKVEKADLQEALGRKEQSEQQLVLELESLQRQLQQAAQELAALREESSVLWSQKETLANEAAAREAALRKEVESLTREQLETRKQSEKDHTALLLQMRVLESELEDQLSQHRGCAQLAEEVTTLKQQLAALDKHLRSQRQFMDEQATEREHEREEFQQEIQRLEGQLRQAARPRPCTHDSQVELLQEKLKEKSDGFNELVIKKDLADQQLLIQEEEIKCLKETNANTQRQVAQLQEELEKQEKNVKELKDKVTLKEQQMLPVSQSRLNEDGCPMFLPGKTSEGPEVQLEVAQQTLLQHESEVLDLKEQLEKIQDDLVNKNEEILHLNLKLEMQNNPAAISLQEPQEEKAGLKAKIEELKAIIENLQENQERLRKDKAEEREQLHEVIEKLQRELSIMGPKVHELSDHQAESLHSELICFQTEGLGGQTLRAELEAALTAKEALGQLLADQAQGHNQALKGLQQRLQAAEEAAARHLAELESCVTVKEAEIKGMASQIQEFEAVLKAKEAVIVQKDLEIDTMNKRKVAHSLELEAILLALTHFRHALEQQPLATTDEPPELQQLRVQCARLSHQLQVLNQQFLRCQMELGQQQAYGVPCASPHPRTYAQAKCDDQLIKDNVSRWSALATHSQDPQDDLQPAKVLVTLKDTERHKTESMMSVLTVCQRQLEAEMLLMKNEMCSNMDKPSRGPEGMQAEEKQPEGCQLQKVDLLAQVKVLQEKLLHLMRSMAFQDISTEDPMFRQPLALLYVSAFGSSNSSHNGEETDMLPPVDAFNTPIDVIKNQDSLMQREKPGFPTQEKLVSQSGPLSSQTSENTGSFHVEEAEPQKDPVRALDLSSWSSPEVLRKDLTPEPQSSQPLTPSTVTMSMNSANTSLQDWTDSLLQASVSGLLCYTDRSAAGQTSLWAVVPSAEHHQVESTAAEKDIEEVITSFDSQEQSRSLLELEGRSNGNRKSDGAGIGAMLTLDSGGPEAPTIGLSAALASRGIFQPPGVMKEKEVHVRHMKALLQMVFDESHQILALSESRDLLPLNKGEPHDPLDGFPRERQVWLEAISGEKEPSDAHLAWSRERLQAMQEVFSTEQENAGLQHRPCGSDLGDYSSLFMRLEKVIREQGDLQEKAQEHLCLPDRSSLLSEIQALRAQLRMTHLQNQEKLQHLCTALTSAEAHGSQREHQLRRQVELLAYKVEQEKCIASDLQKTLSKEQEKAREARKHLVGEQTAVRDLKSELHECKQENARLLESLNKVQQEVLQLRAMLDGKESELKVTLNELECERGKKRALQAQQEEEQLQHLQREGQSSRALEELKISLEKQRAQNNQLCVALKHERVSKDNLLKELQIESSRCEAFLAQKQSQVSELQKSLEAEKSHSLELSEALRHERLLTEQLSRNTQEACAHQETQVQHALLRKLKAEKARTLELQAMLEKVQQQAVHAQQQLEAQAQKRFSELKREKERELELQRQRNGHKMEQLQRMVRELQCKEEVPWGNRPCQGSHRLESLGLDHIREQQQELEKIRQQLLCVAGLLTGFTSRTVDRTINDWTSSNEKAVSSLMRTLEELKSELSMPTSSQKKMAAELQVQLVDELMKDNESLTKAVSTAAREKADLCRAVSQLEKTLKHHVQKGCTLSRPSKSAWKQDGTVLHSLPQHSDSRWPTAASDEEANTCNIKMEKLYLHCLRAESFRKALIYQKKYLLLLIGGFQDSEQETLSMIAHLGVFPSKADKKITSRPFTKFRTAVRVVIAVLRLQFLVKKWQEVDRRGALTQGRTSRPGRRMPRRKQSPPGTRVSLPTQGMSSSNARNSLQSPRSAAAVSLSRKDRSTSPPNSRLERSLTTSQDPEHSLTEYIHHLEMIQQRLGGVPQDSTQKSCHQKIKQ